jgi:parallel beta-helix repeat protein
VRRTVLTTCGVVRTPGHYLLQADLVGSGCLQFLDTSDVHLDCAGHRMSGLLAVTSTTNFSVTGCVSAMQFFGVSDGIVTNSTITSAFNYRNSNVQFVNDTFVSTVARGALEFDDGHDNQVRQSSFTSHYDGSAGPVGTDDAIILMNESNDTIQGNTFDSFYDAGIEGIDTLSNTTIADNTFIHLGVAGVGSYWCTSWTNNTIRHNTTTTSATLVFVEYSTSASLCGTPFAPAKFVGTLIADNSFRSPISGYQGRLSRGRIDVGMPGEVHDNLVKDNDLGANEGPRLAPSSGYFNGGGNVCGVFPNITNFPCVAPSVVTDALGFSRRPR